MSLLKNREIVYTVIISILTLSLIGCGYQEDSKSGGENVMENKMATEEQLQILKSTGLRNDDIEKIKEEGMSPSTRSFVETAQMMLTYLEEKYGNTFEVAGGYIPGILSKGYGITAYAIDGDHSYQRFEITYNVDKEGNGYYEEGYFSIMKRDEVQEYLQKIADDEESGIKVITSLSGKVGKEYTPDMTTQDIVDLGNEVKVYVFGFMLPDVEEEQFYSMSEKVARRFEDTGLKIDYNLYRLRDKNVMEQLQSYKDIKKVFPDGIPKLCDIKYREIIIPKGHKK